MSTNDNQDIDVFDLFRWLKSQLKKFLIYGFRFFRFVFRNILIILLLLVIGVVAGYGLSKLLNPLKTAEILVAPNVKSTAYLYGKIEELDRSASDDKSVINKDFSIVNLKEISIEPVEDITSVLKNLEEFPVDIVPRISENYDDKSNFFDKPLYAPAYDVHKITLVASDTIAIESFLAYLEKQEYFQDKRKALLKSIATELEANKFTIAQIDSTLGAVPSALKQDRGTITVMGSNENSELSAIVNTKSMLLERNAYLEQTKAALDRVFKVYSQSNWVNKTSLRSLLIYILPILLISIFILYHLILRFKNRYSKELQ